MPDLRRQTSVSRSSGRTKQACRKPPLEVWKKSPGLYTDPPHSRRAVCRGMDDHAAPHHLTARWTAYLFLARHIRRHWSLLDRRAQLLPQYRYPRSTTFDNISYHTPPSLNTSIRHIPFTVKGESGMDPLSAHAPRPPRLASLRPHWPGALCPGHPGSRSTMLPPAYAPTLAPPGAAGHRSTRTSNRTPSLTTSTLPR